MTILDTIVTEKIREVEIQKRLVSVESLKKKPHYSRKTISLKQALLLPESSGIIAEFKRKSPSKGIINDQIAIEEVTTGYARSKATGLSILTDQVFFGGTIKDLLSARMVNTIPILRKDFMIDPYQIIEAKAMGADVILLIAAILDRDQIKALVTCARNLSLEILFEIHSEEELQKIPDEADMVGINNRNLKTFEVDIAHSIALAKRIPERFVKVSESGLDDPGTIRNLRTNGFRGFLIGENFMKQLSPAEACSQFINQI